MPKRKRLPASPDYSGLPRYEEKMLVQKSRPLASLTQTQMTLPELKILDVYLSRINSHEPEKRFVRFEKGELEKILGVSRILRDDLDKRLQNLFQVVTIKDPEKPRGFTKIGLFERAEAVQDETGLWQVDLVCTPSAREYIFDIEHLKYLHYRLHSVISLTSRYSYALFLYFEDNDWRKSWDVPLDELKRILRCTASTYDSYKDFSKDVLKRCQQELTEKTERRFSYSPVKRGRKVVAVHFEMVTQQDQIPGQMELQDIYPEVEEKVRTHHMDQIDLLAEACRPTEDSEPEFNREEIEAIFELIVTLPDSALPAYTVTDSIEIKRYHYLAQTYKRMLAADSRSKIKHRFQYLCKLIKQDQE